MFARAGILMAALAVAGLAGCVTNTRANLSNAAQNLEYNANALVSDTRHEVARGDESTIGFHAATTPYVMRSAIRTVGRPDAILAL